MLDCCIFQNKGERVLLVLYSEMDKCARVKKIEDQDPKLRDPPSCWLCCAQWRKGKLVLLCLLGVHKEHGEERAATLLPVEWMEEWQWMEIVCCPDSRGRGDAEATVGGAAGGAGWLGMTRGWVLIGGRIWTLYEQYNSEL